jgi:hypothetical protein
MATVAASQHWHRQRALGVRFLTAMTGDRMNRVHLAVAAAMASLMLATPAALASTTIYRSTQEPLPGNVVSVGFEATSASEFGDEITFAHTQRHLTTVTVTMSSWACQAGTWTGDDCVTTPGAKFFMPITLDLYRATTTAPSMTPVQPGSLFASVTKTFKIPYRPSASPKCTGSEAGEWFLKHHGCFNGKAANIVFNLASLHLKLPKTIVYGVAYNTSDYGSEPIGDSAPCHSTPQGCPYDSLNVGVAPSVKVGSKPYPGTVFWSTTYAPFLCDATPLVGVFNLDSPTTACWAGDVPAVQFRATS